MRLDAARAGFGGLARGRARQHAGRVRYSFPLLQIPCMGSARAPACSVPRPRRTPRFIPAKPLASMRLHAARAGFGGLARGRARQHAGRVRYPFPLLQIPCMGSARAPACSVPRPRRTPRFIPAKPLASMRLDAARAGFGGLARGRARQHARRVRYPSPLLQIPCMGSARAPACSVLRPRRTPRFIPAKPLASMRLDAARAGFGGLARGRARQHAGRVRYPFPLLQIPCMGSARAPACSVPRPRRTPRFIPAKPLASMRLDAARAGFGGLARGRARQHARRVRYPFPLLQIPCMGSARAPACSVLRPRRTPRFIPAKPLASMRLHAARAGFGGLARGRARQHARRVRYPFPLCNVRLFLRNGMNQCLAGTLPDPLRLATSLLASLLVFPLEPSPDVAIRRHLPHGPIGKQREVDGW